MSWSRLIFRDKITVNADYTEMVSFFRKRLDQNYFKGHIDKHQTQLFCYWEFFPGGINTPLPVCQVNFENEKDPDGRIEVRFKIVNALVILFAIVTGAVFYGMFISEVPLQYALLVPTAGYLYLTFRYNVDFRGLMSDITDIEERHEHRISNTEL